MNYSWALENIKYGCEREEESRDGSYIKALKGNFIAIVLLRPQFIYVRGKMMKRTFWSSNKTTFLCKYYQMKLMEDENGNRNHPLDYFRWLLKNLSISRLCCVFVYQARRLCDNMCSGLEINDLVIFIGSPSRLPCFIYLPPEVPLRYLFLFFLLDKPFAVWTLRTEHKRRCFRFLLSNTQYC